MDDQRDRVASFITDHPDCEDALEELIELQNRENSWTFDDVSLDSGRFGEIVARDIVEKTPEGRYRLADPDAVRQVLTQEEPQATSNTRDQFQFNLAELPPRDRRFAAGLVVVIGLLVLFRTIAFPSVFRNEFVVLSANDPYFYRYWVEHTLAKSTTLFDRDVLVNPPLAKGEPLLVITLWWGTILLGGTSAAGGFVLAWYPVVSAIITGILVYLIGTWVFADRRVGLAATVMVALIPVHGFRASLGFADHHPFDYFWLTVTVAGLVLVTHQTRDQSLRSRRLWGGIIVLLLGISGQTLAWDASPIVLGALGLYLAITVIGDVYHDASPFRRNVPMLLALLGAVIVTHMAHTRLSWHTGQVAYAPGIILVGGIGVIAVAEMVHRLAMPAWSLIGIEGVGVYMGWRGLAWLLPEYAVRLSDRLILLVSDRGIAEMAGLFGQELGRVFGPVILFGFILFLAVPYLVWFTRSSLRTHRPALLGVCLFAWYYFGLAILQIRFAGELTPILAVIAGFGLVQLAGKIEVTKMPTPQSVTNVRGNGGMTHITRSNVFALVLLVGLVGSLSLVQIPVKTNQIAVENPEYDAMTWMVSESEARSLSYPENYVFSDWGRNRMYNYFVNGQSRSYRFAQSNYPEFIASKDPEGWFGRLEGRTGYIVVKKSSRFSNLPENTLFSRFTTNYGSGDAQTNGFAHYRIVYTDQDGGVLIVMPVKGATITGTANPNTSITITTTVTVSGAEFSYSRHTDVSADGNFSVTVAYPGAYMMDKSSVRVSESDVINGTTIQID